MSTVAEAQDIEISGQGEQPKMSVLSFRAMGSRCRIVVNEAASSAATDAENLIADLEGRWSRFLPTSEISQLNEQAGNMMVVSPATYTLISLACTARRLTGGVFNPLMLTQLKDLGYRDPWNDEGSQSLVSKMANGPATVTSEDIDLFPELSAIRLPPGTQFDPGGIGKGLAADMATDLLIAAGATTTSVELGGDVRVSGTAWYGPSWRVGVTHPFDDDAEVAAFTPESGAVATSSRLGRCWEVDGEARHHLLDPSTGRSAQTDLVASTVCADTAWWAEVVAKVILIGGSETAHFRWNELSAAGIAVTSSGAVLQSRSGQANSSSQEPAIHEMTASADGEVETDRRVQADWEAKAEREVATERELTREAVKEEVMA